MKSFNGLTVRIKKIIFCLIITVFVAGYFLYNNSSDAENASFSELIRLKPGMMPWQGVGGCGAGGSGGGSDGIKWIGEGVSGGILDVEILPKFNFGQNFHFISIAPRFSVKPTWKTGLGLSIPFSSKTASVQFGANLQEQTMTTGGLGDITFDVSRIVGSEGQFSLGFSLTIPTGQYDIKRGPESDKKILPNNLQMGGGIYNAGFTLNYTKDVENGMWLFDAGYNYPFNLKLFSKENEFIDSYYSNYKDQIGNARFYYRAKHYGENDLGDYVPPSLSLGAVYAYRGKENFVHSVGLTFSAPLGVAWIHSYKTDIYNPIPDPDHKAWRASLSYGLEFSREKFPVYIAIAKPISDKSPGDTKGDPNPMKKWNAPDWESFKNEWIIAVGIKSTMF